jgi:RNA polymerase sigma factor (sigma-70 family)
MDYKKVLLDHLDLIDRVVRHTARVHYLRVPDAEELASLVHLKLIDNDFAVLRKFQGRSSLRTYLTTVIERIYLDFRAAKWGKWRPSAAARRLGPVAILLEQLIYRDGLTFEEAVGTLQINHQIRASREELHELFVRLPMQSRRGMADGRELAAVVGLATSAERRVQHASDRNDALRVEAVLVNAIGALPVEDQLLLKFRYLDGRGVREIAQLLQISESTFHRRLAELITTLRQNLVEQGIDKSLIHRLVGDPAISLSEVLQAISADLTDLKNRSV